MTVVSGVRATGGSAGGVVPASNRRDNLGQREIYDHPLDLEQPFAPGVAEAAGDPMRPAILEKRKRVNDSRPVAPLQVELELPLVAPDDRDSRAPVARPDTPDDRGVAVIDFYI